MNDLDRLTSAAITEAYKTHGIYLNVLTARNIVKAMLKELREPSEKMKTIEETHWNYHCNVCGGLTEGWYKYIDCIINE